MVRLIREYRLGSATLPQKLPRRCVDFVEEAQYYERLTWGSVDTFCSPRIFGHSHRRYLGFPSDQNMSAQFNATRRSRGRSSRSNRSRQHGGSEDNSSQRSSVSQSSVSLRRSPSLTTPKEAPNGSTRTRRFLPLNLKSLRNRH